MLDNIVISCVAASLPILIPTAQFGLIYKLWSEFDLKVDRKGCRNSCWDTVFKGSYESGHSSRYKHVFFNVNFNTFCILFSTVLAIILLYEASKHVLRAIHNGNAELPNIKNI